VSEALDYSLAHAFPLVRSGGAFLMLMGAGLVIGAPVYPFRYIALAIGAAGGAAALALLAYPLAAPYGPPTLLALTSIAAAIVFEAILLAAFAPRLRNDRARTIAVLVIVGAHFIIMAPAFSPLIAVLGVLCLANALAGALVSAYPMPALWTIDGLLKIAAGAAMWFAPLLPGDLFGPAFTLLYG
jgi:hypothetical protein